jgi:hypothetical protein
LKVQRQSDAFGNMVHIEAISDHIGERLGEMQPHNMVHLLQTLTMLSPPARSTSACRLASAPQLLAFQDKVGSLRGGSNAAATLLALERADLVDPAGDLAPPMDSNSDGVPMLGGGEGCGGIGSVGHGGYGKGRGKGTTTTNTKWSSSGYGNGDVSSAAPAPAGQRVGGGKRRTQRRHVRAGVSENTVAGGNRRKDDCSLDAWSDAIFRDPPTRDARIAYDLQAGYARSPQACETNGGKAFDMPMTVELPAEGLATWQPPPMVALAHTLGMMDGGRPSSAIGGGPVDPGGAYYAEALSKGGAEAGWLPLAPGSGSHRIFFGAGL